MKTLASYVCVLLITVGLGTIPGFAQQAGITISGKITGASGKHPVYVALWDASGFLTKPVQQMRIEAHANLQYQFRAAAGSWAVSVYEDENENGKLDMGMFGPKEPSGFWRAFHGWHKPRFSEVSSSVDKDVPNGDISLH